MPTPALKPPFADSYVSDRVFDGTRCRDADASARDRDRAQKALERIRGSGKTKG